MKALITGIPGFVGSHLAELLLKKNSEVFGTCLACESLENIQPFKKRIELFECDVTDFDRLKRLVKKIMPDQIYHLAAFSSVGKSFEKPLRVVEINVRGTLYLLDILKDIKKITRILVVGSTDVYGRVKKSQLPIKETCGLFPISPYGASKACADVLAYQYFQSYGVNAIRTRSFNHTGPRQSRGFVIPDFASQIARIHLGFSKPQMKVGNLEAKRDLSDVRDVVRAYHLLLQRGKPGEAYNVCSGKAFKIKYLLNHLLKLIPREIKVLKLKTAKRPVDIPVLLGDNKKIKKEVNWRPEISIERTLEDTFEFWLQRYQRR
ncbi:MAG: hypothetical protein AMJ90_04885 [candidate division Zixibacteria bacterium SM23_73_2]|nr:MAG: hypothetical protein AMJ90_04885 [candidate division Zixibacteria bacterium SM23_73_2]